MMSVVQKSLQEAAHVLDLLQKNQAACTAIEQAGKKLVEAYRAGGKVITCGNGGSLCDAMHFAEELTGKFRSERAPLAALAIADPAHLSCTANDFDYDAVFSRFVEAHGRPGDVLVAISTSGQSRNVIKAAESAKQNSVTVVALTGRDGSALGELADVEICTQSPYPYSDRIQELHIKVIHILIEMIEIGLFENS